MNILLHFATPKDKALMALGLLCAAISGAAFPVMTIVFGQLSNYLVQYVGNFISSDKLIE